MAAFRLSELVYNIVIKRGAVIKNLSKNTRFHRYGHSATTIIIVTIATALLAYCALMIWQQYQATNKPASSISQSTLRNSTNEPEETKPNCNNYKVADHLPRKITLPSINSSGCIIRVGIDQDNAIAVPGNIHLAGWYTNSPLPGKKGVSIIDGHVSGKYNPGIFKKLKQLRTGDQYKIEFGDKSTKTFQVVSVKEYTPDETTKKMYEQSTSIERQLNLITCGGQFDKKSNQYEKRILVTSKLVTASS